MLYPLPAPQNPFLRAFIIKDSANNRRDSPYYSISVLITPFPVTAFINEEATGCINEKTIQAINEATIGTIIDPENGPYWFFILCLAVSVE